MTDEDTNTPQPQGEKPLNIVEEARAIRDEIRAEREKLEAANAEAKQIAAENMLGGENGGHQEAKPKEEVSPEAYVDSIMNGELPDGV